MNFLTAVQFLKIVSCLHLDIFHVWFFFECSFFLIGETCISSVWTSKTKEAKFL